VTGRTPATESAYKNGRKSGESVDRRKRFAVALINKVGELIIVTDTHKR